MTISEDRFSVFAPTTDGAKAFLAAEMEDVCYVRFVDVLERWQRLGGNHRQLMRAAERGPYKVRREDTLDGKLWIYHNPPRTEDAYDRMVADVLRRWRESKD